MRELMVLLAATTGLDVVSGLDGRHGGRDGTVSDVSYAVEVGREQLARREIAAEMTFLVSGPGEVILSIPAWTPGSYELDHFARHVSDFSATLNGAPLRWDKSDFDSWRVHPQDAGEIRIRFLVRADTLDVGMAGARDDFVYFNGTNLFPYPEGQGFDFPARVSVSTEPDWLIATGMRSAGDPGEYEAGDYHELVDMPFFVGRFDLDSTRVDDRWYRLATYPEGILSGRTRAQLWEQIAATVPPMAAVFGETPWDDYTILAMFDEEVPGGSALEHRDSHLGMYTPALIGSPILALVIAHETFHAWNVKRLRPEALWPYVYDRASPTTLLWVSEGITDYYADLALVRGGVIGPDLFYWLQTHKMQSVEEASPVSLEDASLSTWIEPADGTAFLYYEKGSLAGLLLDILIRDATDNTASLDHVLRRLYREEYGRGSGFTEEEWWAAVRETAGGASFEEFRRRYVDGRDPFPWEEVLPLAGMRRTESVERRPFIDVEIEPAAEGARIVSVAADSPAEEAGLQVGDYLIRVDDIEAESPDFATRFRRRFADAEAGTPVRVVVSRGGLRVDIDTVIEVARDTVPVIGEDPAAAERARRIRAGILEGRVDD